MARRRRSARRRRPVEQVRLGWWREPPLWAWLAVVVGAVAIGVLAPYALQRGQVTAPEAGRPGGAAASTGTPAGTAPATPTAAPADVPTTRIVVVGDRDTGGPGDTDTGVTAWPALLGQRLGDLEVQIATAPGAGYATPDPGTGQTFADLVAAAPVGDAMLVVVVGSRNDGPGIADEVGQGADAVLADVRQQAPDAQVVVVGPLWPSATVPAGVRNNRDVIAAAAEAAGVTFVDPLTDGWLADRPGLVTGDADELTAAGHAFVADRVEPVVRAALGGP